MALKGSFVRRRVKTGFNTVSQGDQEQVVEKFVSKSKVLPTDTVLDPLEIYVNRPTFIRDTVLADLALREVQGEIAGGFEAARKAREIPEFELPETAEGEQVTTVDADER